MTSDLTAPVRSRAVRTPPAPSRSRPIQTSPAVVLPDVVLARQVPEVVAAVEVREERWSRVRRGAYLPIMRSADLPAVGSGPSRTTELARIAAVSRQLRDPVISHDSAALLWGSPLWRVPEQVHVTQPTSPSGTRSADIRRHRAVLDPDDVARREGVRLTTVDRTLLDCSMTMRPLAGLVVADALLRGGADLVHARAMLGQRRRANGVRLARWVLDHADIGSESPGETLTRYVLLAHGFPRPALQVPVAADGRTYWADLGWPEWKVLIEFDGMVKYRELAGGAPAEVVVAEKRRQEAIEDAGHAVIRVMYRDLFPASAFLERVRRRLPSDVARGLRPRRELLLPASFS